jgi:hypothetical protein
MRVYLENCLVPLPSPEERERLTELAKRCLAGGAIVDYETEIEDRIARLYEV